MKIPVRFKQAVRTSLYAVNGFFSDIVLEINGGAKRSREYLSSVRDQFAGQRCFVIGNGPSLTAEDLSSLSNEITFASNRIAKIFDTTDWRPTYFGMLDDDVVRAAGVKDGINRTECSKMFFLKESYSSFHDIKGDICWLHAWYQRKYLKNPQFSNDLTKGVYCIATVTYMLIQIAAYMGFTEIYLLGCDNTYAVERNKDGTLKVNVGKRSYFGAESEQEKASIGASWEADIAYGFAEKYSREHNFRIYNATRGGALEIFERRDLDEVLRQR